MVEYNLTLDVKRSDMQALLKGFKTGDTGTREVIITLADGKKRLELPENVTAVLVVTRPDGEKYIGACTVDTETGKISHVFATDELSLPGTVLCELRVMQLVGYDEDDDPITHVLTSPMFSVLVREVMYDAEAVESSDEFDALTVALGEVEKLDMSMDGKVITFTNKDGENSTLAFSEKSGGKVTVTFTDTDSHTSSFDIVDGAKGDKGDKGDKGETGPQGVKGDKGDTGETGPQGVQGPQGIQGSPGADGLDGEDGASVSSMTINADGELVSTLTDGTSLNAGEIPSNLFFCTYGNTTQTEIRHAIEAGKHPVCIRTIAEPEGLASEIRLYVYIGKKNGYDQFIALKSLSDKTSIYKIGCNLTTWVDSTTVVLETQANRDSTTVTSSETKYPTSAAVRNYLSINGIVKGDGAGHLSAAQTTQGTPVAIDTEVTPGSGNLITSGAVGSALADKQTKSITDAGGYFATKTVEGALQQLGSELVDVDELLGSGEIQ